ncbi:aminotransferase class IV [Myxococcota bacterium]|nr:aminotransferase class IV [Myxococcota bacterium]
MIRTVREGGETRVVVGVGDRARTFRPEDLGLTEALLRFLDYPPAFQVDAWLARGRDDFRPLWTEAVLLQWFEGGSPLGQREIAPYGYFPIPTAAGALNYAQSVFEGCKAYVMRDREGLVLRLFRIRDAARRMRLSARRLAIDVPASSLADLFERGIPELLAANARSLATAAFDPRDPAAARFFEGGDPDARLRSPPPAGYVRPLLAAWAPVLGVRPAGRYLFTTHVTPVGPYRGAMRVALSARQRRAMPHGTGAAKAAANYARTLNLYRDRDEAVARDPSRRYDDFLFTDGAGNLEEFSGANVFVASVEDGRPVLRTPRYVERAPTLDAPAADLDAELRENTFLNGMTRRTVLELAPLLGFDVREESHLPLAHVTRDPASRAVFATGTAAVMAEVTHVGSLDPEGFRALGLPADATEPLALRPWDASDPLIDRLLWLKHALLACQYGLPTELAKLARAPGASPEVVQAVSRRSEEWRTELRVPLP